ncbi:MAG: hypothetical protein ACRD2B_13000, partial [Terriglobia bacterium]
TKAAELKDDSTLLANTHGTEAVTWLPAGELILFSVSPATESTALWRLLAGLAAAGGVVWYASRKAPAPGHPTSERGAETGGKVAGDEASGNDNG